MAEEDIESVSSELATPLLVHSESHPLLDSVNRVESLESILDKELEGWSWLVQFFGPSGSRTSVTVRLLLILLFGGVIPMSIFWTFGCSGLISEIGFTASYISLAIVPIFYLAIALQRGGIKQFLTEGDAMEQFLTEDDAMKKCIEILRVRAPLLVWLVVCLLLKVLQEVLRGCKPMGWKSIILGCVSSAAWAYSTTTFICACTVFHFACKFQIARFEHIQRNLSNEPDSFLLLKEYLLTQRFISRINGFFQPFLRVIIPLVIVSFGGCVWGAIHRPIVSSIVDVAIHVLAQVGGLGLCLRAALQVSHGAQRVVSSASCWQALVTCADGVENPLEGLKVEGIIMPSSGLPSYSEAWQRNFNSYRKYLEVNNGGIKVYGLIVNSSFVYMLFGTCLSLILFVLSTSLDWMAIRESSDKIIFWLFSQLGFFMLEATNRMASMFSESDLESLDYIAVPTNHQLASYMTSYQRRKAFVMYLQNNPGGITIFGWTVDRGLVNTIFFLELTFSLFMGRQLYTLQMSDPWIFLCKLFSTQQSSTAFRVFRTIYIAVMCPVLYWLLLFPVNHSASVKSYKVSLSCQSNQVLSLAVCSSSSDHIRHA